MGKEPEKIRFGKDILHLTHFKGAMFKPCPGTKEYLCCGYQILHLGTNCPLDCSYCILQSYFDHPEIHVFVNIEEQIENILHGIDSRPNEFFRVGTGEFMDSLALDHITGFTRIINPLFAKKHNAVLELKTKTVKIDGLLSTKERDRIIVSWSLNSPWIAAREEKRAPSIELRLKAAQTCQKEGFIIGFHFDPLIRHPGWKEEYQKTLDMMVKYIDPKRVVWVSMGSFRYISKLKAIIRKQHPDSCVLNGEFVPGLDGKMRYFKPIRMELYGFMNERLKAWYDDLGIYLCMESPEIWETSLGFSPADSGALGHYLDQRALKFFA